MVTYIACDRCKKNINDPSVLSIKKIRVGYDENKEVSDWDLCTRCRAELFRFLQGAKLA